MVKQIITAILLLAFLGQALNGAVIVTSYYTNTAAYAKNCVNKAKPAMHCNGRCQMMKKLKQEEKKDQDTPERKADKSFNLYCSWEDNSNNLSITANDRTSFATMPDLGKPVGMPRKVLHPPA